MVLGILMIPLGIVMFGDAFFSNIGVIVEGDTENPQYQQSSEDASIGMSTLIVGFFMFITGLVSALILRRK